MAVSRKFNVFVDSGAPTFYNKLTKSNPTSESMGSRFGDRHRDSFEWVEQEEVETYHDEYLKYLKKERYITACACFDIINNAPLTYENMKQAKARGVPAIPIFHLGTPLKWLQKYIDEGHDYIALGGITPNPVSVTLPILDRLWSLYLTDDAGLPRCKVHGLAVTSPQLMARYPWYSVDSTTWLKHGIYGKVLVPTIKKGKLDFMDYVLIFVSEKSSKRAVPPYGLDVLSPRFKDHVEAFIESCGSTLKGVETDSKERLRVNAMYFLRLAKSLPKWPWAFKKHIRKGLFDDRLLGR